MKLADTLSRHKIKSIVLAVILTGVLTSVLLIFLQHSADKQVSVVPQQSTEQKSTIDTSKLQPTLTTETAVSGLSHPWEVAFLPDNTLLFTERNGKLSQLQAGQTKLIAQVPGVYSAGEGGLMGLAVDRNFSTNGYLYLCFNARTAVGLDVRVLRAVLSVDKSALSEQKAIVTGIPGNSTGRHSGCRLAMDETDVLWIGTGDAAQYQTSQDPKSLGGKILRVTRDGMPAGNNLPEPFDPRIFSYGHRNTQGLTIFAKPRGEVFGYSVEHGSYRDDEVNLLQKGNFGWAALRGYNESPPMTDKSRFPEAIGSIWSSGEPTIAPSGATLLTGQQWGAWNGRLAMAVLKAKQLRVLEITNDYQVASDKTILAEFGRLRTAVQGPDGNLYITTDNGSSDKIIMVTPKL